MQKEQELLTQLAAVAEMINSRNEQASSRMSNTAAALERNARDFSTSGDRLSQEVLRTLGAQSVLAISQAAGHALAGLDQQLQHATHKAQQLDQELAAQRSRIRVVMIGALSALVIGAILAMGGSIYLVRYRMRALDNVSFGEDIHRATQAGTINRCDGQLCVRVGRRPERFPQNPDYVLVGN